MLEFLALSFLFASQVASQTPIACPVVSKTYSPPQNISSSSIWEKAVATLNQNLSKLVTQNISVAIQIHSKDSTDPLFEYYRKAPGHHYGPNGQKPVDGDTIFRIGSMTKMFTVYALLIECGFTCFEEPITKYVPELRNLKYDNEIDNVNWEEIMIAALAAQISGIGRDYALADYTAQSPAKKSEWGLPPLAQNDSMVPKCGTLDPIPGCNREESFQLLLQHPPVFEAWDSPSYSNIAYQLIGYVLEARIGKNYSEIIKDSIFKPLNMTHASVTAPSSTDGIVVGNNTDVFNWDVGDLAPAGSFYMSSVDVAKHIHAVLNHKQLSAVNTRRWLKPVSHTNNLYESVGAPWEIFRPPFPPYDSSSLVEIYKKAGGMPQYTSKYALIPDFDVGYSIMAAMVDEATFENELLNVIVPALYEIAREQMSERFVGTYTNTDSGFDSSLTVGMVPDGGLVVEHWISNGTEASYAIADDLGNAALPLRLYPAGLIAGRGSKQLERVAFRAGIGGIPSGNCWSWVRVDGFNYGNLPLDEFIFKIGSDGTAVSVVNRGLRIELTKISKSV